jgi:hypothetical protein
MVKVKKSYVLYQLLLAVKAGGLLQTILGAVLLVAGVVVTGLSYGWAAPVGGALTSAGIGLMAGGVIQMLSPQTPGWQANRILKINRLMPLAASRIQQRRDTLFLCFMAAPYRRGNYFCGIYVEDQQ